MPGVRNLPAVYGFMPIVFLFPIHGTDGGWNFLLCRRKWTGCGLIVLAALKIQDLFRSCLLQELTGEQEIYYAG